MMNYKKVSSPTRGCRQHLDRIRVGYSEGWYNHRKYGITKQVFNREQSFKVYAEELGGKDVISLNYYVTAQQDALRPCEMSAQKVIHFLTHVQLL